MAEIVEWLRVVMVRLSEAELEDARVLLGDYAPAGGALATLSQNGGDLEASLEELVVAEAGTAVFGEGRRSLREVFVRNLRREVCGDEGFLARVEALNRKPGDAALLTGAIVYLVDLVALPMITPAIATVVVLWVVKLGIRVFCEYTEPEEP